MSPGRPRRAAGGEGFASLWSLDPAVTFLNHGSFGACPNSVLEAQSRWRQRMEREPVRFFAKDFEQLLGEALTELGRFIGAKPDDLAFVPNVTTAVNTVLRSLDLEPGDELLTTNHEYNACKNALEFAAEKTGARVVTAAVPFPLRSEEQVVGAILPRVTDRTRLVLVDHVTSPTALVLPVGRLVRALANRGVDTLVDGAHAPGMLPLDLDWIGAAYYAGNLHKWLCAPKGAAFLHVRRDRQDGIRPLVISHGANDPRTERSRFRNEFDWVGTDDPSAYLAVPEAIRLLGSALPTGWPGLMARNHAGALAARDRLCEVLRLLPPCPDDMVGSMIAVPVPDCFVRRPEEDPLWAALSERHRVQVPVFPWPESPKRVLRVSVQLYVEPKHVDRLATALRAELRAK